MATSFSSYYRYTWTWFINRFKRILISYYHRLQSLYLARFFRNLLSTTGSARQRHFEHGKRRLFDSGWSQMRGRIRVSGFQQYHASGMCISCRWHVQWHNLASCLECFASRLSPWVFRSQLFAHAAYIHASRVLGLHSSCETLVERLSRWVWTVLMWIVEDYWTFCKQIR